MREQINIFRRKKYAFIGCIIFAFIMRAYWFFRTGHLDGESHFRIWDSYAVAENPFVLLINTPPGGGGGQAGYYFINSLLMHFIDEPVLVAKISSFCFGIFSIVAYYAFVNIAFGPIIALGSIFMFSLYALHIQLSIVAMGNAGLLFFVIVSGFYLMKYLEQTRTSLYDIRLILLIVFTIIATSFRLEAWLLVPLFSLILLREKGLIVSVLFGVLSASFVWSVLWLCVHFKGDVWMFLRSSLFQPSVQKPALIPRIFQQGWTVCASLYGTFSIPLFLCGIYGAAIKIKNKKAVIILVLFCGYFLMLAIRQIISCHFAFWRYSAILGVFFIPFICVGVGQVMEIINRQGWMKKKIRTVFMILFPVVLAVYYGYVSVTYLQKQGYRMQYTPFMMQLTNIAEQYIRSGDVLFVSFHSHDLAVAANLNKFMINRDSDIDLLWQQGIIAKEDIPMIMQFVEQLNAQERGQPFKPYLFVKRGDSKTVRRIVFLLNKSDHDYLEGHFHDLYKQMDFKCVADTIYIVGMNARSAE